MAEELKIEKPSKIKGDPQQLFEMINDHDKVIFYTLEPSTKIKGKKRLWGYPILGEKELKSIKNKKTIFKYLVKSIEEGKEGGAWCFSPRHGIRFIKEKMVFGVKEELRLDLVICFECSKIIVYSAKKSSLVIEGKRDVFDKVAKELKMEITKN